MELPEDASARAPGDEDAAVVDDLDADAEEGQGEAESEPSDLPYLMKDSNGRRVLHTVAFLHSNSLGDLMLKKRIKASRHEDFPNLVQLRYSQVGSSMDSHIVRECRGLVLDEANGWAVVCFPYEKFFNAGERHAAAIDWATARATQKLDGSLATLYWFGDRWHVASTTLPDGSGSFGNRHKSLFRDLFWRIWKAKKYNYPTNKQKCYMFEMVSPENVVIVPYQTERIVLHGVRDVASLAEELPDPYARTHGWELPQVFSFRSLEEAQEAARRLSPTKDEGFVVCDASFNRIKVKSPSYVSLTHVVPRANVKSNQRCFLQIVVANESDEFLSYFPQHKWAFMDATRRYTQFCSELVHLMKADSHKAKTNPDKLKLVARLKAAGTTPELPAIREFLSRIELDDFENLLPPPTQQIQSKDAGRRKPKP